MFSPATLFTGSLVFSRPVLFSWGWRPCWGRLRKAVEAARWAAGPLGPVAAEPLALVAEGERGLVAAGPLDLVAEGERGLVEAGRLGPAGAGARAPAAAARGPRSLGSAPGRSCRREASRPCTAIFTRTCIEHVLRVHNLRLNSDIQHSETGVTKWPDTPKWTSTA